MVFLLSLAASCGDTVPSSGVGESDMPDAGTAADVGGEDTPESPADAGEPDPDERMCAVAEDQTLAGPDASAEALRGVCEIDGELSINGTGLTTLEALEALETSQVLLILENDLLEDIAMTGFQRTNTLLMNNNNALVDHSGFPNLTEVTGGFFIYGGNALEDISGFARLTSVGSMEFFFHSTLSTISGINALQSVNSSLSISQNEVLADISGLTSLTSIGGSLNIKSNPNLSSISGLGALVSAGSVEIVNNPQLCQSEVDAFLAGIEVQGEVLTSGNNDGC